MGGKVVKIEGLG